MRGDVYVGSFLVGVQMTMAALDACLNEGLIAAVVDLEVSQSAQRAQIRLLAFAFCRGVADFGSEVFGPDEALAWGKELGSQP
jgi:hypothetical protein